MSQKRIKAKKRNGQAELRAAHELAFAVERGIGVYKYALSATDAECREIAAAADALVDRVVAECMAQVRTRPRSLREARLVKKFEVRNGR